MAATDTNAGPVGPFSDFKEAASAVLRLLQERIGMDLWMMTRTEGDDWIVLNSEDRGYDVKPGDVFRWSDSFCYQMVQGRGPRVAPASDEVPAYAEAPIGQKVPISAYIGVPITLTDGSLFGTLCAIDPKPQPESLRRQLPAIETYSRLLATILNSELERQDEARRAEEAETESERDSLTGLYNLRGWRRLRDAEERRCRRHGISAGIVLIDLDGLKQVNDEQGHAAGDELIQRAAGILEGTTRRTDVAARLGGDEFILLAVEETRQGLKKLVSRVESALAEASVTASVGSALRSPKASLEVAQERADEDMYRRKRAKRQKA